MNPNFKNYHSIMAFYSYPFPSTPLSSYISSFSFQNFFLNLKDFLIPALAATIGNVLSAIFILIFDFVGILLGAMRGALIGRETEYGIIRGPAVGAISGSVISIQVFESSVEMWKADKSGISCVLYLIGIIVSLLNGKLVRERFRPAMLSDLEDLRLVREPFRPAMLNDLQMGDVGTSDDQFRRISEVGGSKGLPEDSIEKIPKITITNNHDVNDSSERMPCSVCLQDFQLGETLRILPKCQHMFHLSCIDKWLVRHGSCPLCRRVQMHEHTNM